eukprot:259452-Amphidinium_carterae.1
MPYHCIRRNHFTQVLAVNSMLTDSVPLESSSTAIPEDSSVLTLSVLSAVPGPRRPAQVPPCR